MPGWGAQIQSDRLDRLCRVASPAGVGRDRPGKGTPARRLAPRDGAGVPRDFTPARPAEALNRHVILCLRVGAGVQGKATGPRRLVNAGSKPPLGVGNRADRIARKFTAAIGRPGNGNVRRASPYRRRAGRGRHGTVATSCTCAAVRRTPRAGRPALIPRSHPSRGPHPHGAEMPRWTGERTQ